MVGEQAQEVVAFLPGRTVPLDAAIFLRCRNHDFPGALCVDSGELGFSLDWSLRKIAVSNHNVAFHPSGDSPHRVRLHLLGLSRAGPSDGPGRVGEWVHFQSVQTYKKENSFASMFRWNDLVIQVWSGSFSSTRRSYSPPFTTSTDSCYCASMRFGNYYDCKIVENHSKSEWMWPKKVRFFQSSVALVDSAKSVAQLDRCGDRRWCLLRWFVIVSRYMGPQPSRPILDRKSGEKYWLLHIIPV